jgi:hypothetical protein
MKVRINCSELVPALYGLVWQVIVVILIAIVAPALYATADEVFAVITLCVIVVAAQAAIHLIGAYVRMSLLLHRIGSGTSGQAEIRGGELLAEMKARGERHSGQAAKGSRVATPISEPTLKDLGVAESQSSRWQQSLVAALSDNTGRKLTD